LIDTKRLIKTTTNNYLREVPVKITLVSFGVFVLIEPLIT